MLRTFVLFLHLVGGQVVTIQGFLNPEDCNATGHWYQSEAQKRNGKVDYYCGPGPASEDPDAPPVPRDYAPPPPSFPPAALFDNLFRGLLRH